LQLTLKKHQKQAKTHKYIATRHLLNMIIKPLNSISYADRRFVIAPMIDFVYTE